MENLFESSIFNPQKDKQIPWFLRQKERIPSFKPDMPDLKINIKISRKGGGELEHSIKHKVSGPCLKGTTLIQWMISLLRPEMVAYGPGLLLSPELYRKHNRQKEN
ncbi:hypothetical protein O181_018942 [Austropuccinia psidii MF-1]|uniref:Uncharacterized protein n=1 Tax=Austropuccinia psidii MF-1 TaxID=1389203 RepID=A0A9Q3C8S5_9BASI|nr:hypothetical protein [Austropuccinia psidii MF-1]